jgi:hypothetical protein
MCKDRLNSLNRFNRLSVKETKSLSPQDGTHVLPVVAATIRLKGFRYRSSGSSGSSGFDRG